MNDCVTLSAESIYERRFTKCNNCAYNCIRSSNPSCVAVVKKWEKFLLLVSDVNAPMRHNNGQTTQYCEWDNNKQI